MYCDAIKKAYVSRRHIDNEFVGIEDIDIVLCIPVNTELSEFELSFKFKLVKGGLNIHDDINYIFYTIGVSYNEPQPSDDVLIEYANECWSIIYTEQQTGEHEFPFNLVED